MNKKLLIVAVVSIVAIATIGTGFAVGGYTAKMISTDTVQYDGYSVNILDNNGNQLNQPLYLEGLEEDTDYTDVNNVISVTGTSKSVEGYVAVHAPTGQTANVREWIMMNDVRSWSIIESITISIDSGSSTVLYNSNSTSTSNPSANATLTNGDHHFVLTVTYKTCTLYVESSESRGFLDLSGSKLMFALSNSDPLSA